MPIFLPWSLALFVGHFKVRFQIGSWAKHWSNFRLGAAHAMFKAFSKNVIRMSGAIRTSRYRLQYWNWFLLFRSASIFKANVVLHVINLFVQLHQRVIAIVNHIAHHAREFSITSVVFSDLAVGEIIDYLMCWRGNADSLGLSENLTRPLIFFFDFPFALTESQANRLQTGANHQTEQ